MGSVNERLRTAMIQTGVTADELALCCGVDVKNAERWISPGRVPHRTHRWAAARRLGYEESYLWPDVRRSASRRAEAQYELVHLYAPTGRALHQLLRADVGHGQPWFGEEV